MILDLTKSKLFSIDPDLRFCKEYAVPIGTWTECWRRYKLMGYSAGDIKDFVFIKRMRSLSYTTIDRWIFRTEIYSIVNPHLKKGVKHVNSDIFKEYEQEVINELVKKLKTGESNNSNIII